MRRLRAVEATQDGEYQRGLVLTEAAQPVGQAARLNQLVHGLHEPRPEHPDVEVTDGVSHLERHGDGKVRERATARGAAKTLGQSELRGTRSSLCRVLLHAHLRDTVTPQRPITDM